MGNKVLNQEKDQNKIHS